MEERADYGTYHIAQESVRRDGKDPLAGLCKWHPSGFRYTAVVRFDVGMQFAEAREVDISGKKSRRFIHTFEVELTIGLQHQAFHKRIFLLGQIVMVSPGDGIEARVGIGFDRSHSVYDDVAWEEFIEPFCQGGSFRRRIAGKIRMCYHLVGMNSCIGSSCSDDTDRLAHDGRYGFLYGLLHTGSIRLRLPAAVAYAR